MPETELERARSHLLVCQASLAFIRQKARSAADKVTVYFAEGDFLAALSWVWDAQEREEADYIRRAERAYRYAYTTHG